MGAWSSITKSVGGLVKNTIKVGVGYGIGEAIYGMNTENEDPTKAGMAGVAGIAGMYAVPAVGSKLFGFFKDRVSDFNDPAVKGSKSGCWKAIGKSVALLAGGAFAANQIGKWYSEYKDATDNVHNPSQNEYLRMSSQSDQSQTSRTADELFDNIHPESSTEELSYE